MSEQNRHPDNIEELLHQEAVEIFGPERMAQLQGHEATEESTQELINAVSALCAEPVSTEHHGLHFRDLQRSKGKPLHIKTNPTGITGFGDNQADAATVSISNLKSGRAPRPRHYPPFGYEFQESIFVDHDGVAKIGRAVWARLGNVTQPSAVKRASEDEIQEALDILADAVHYHDELNAKTESAK
ncbi:MAG TPA: hypothetical protein VLF39_03515 [Candidatus Saccharimonadales bacterium]|nr:hypothetical protein [Candidatus Saccharimonadales bacterium]